MSVHADTISTLADTVQRWKTSHDALVAENSRLNVSEAAWCARAIEAEAENQRLRDVIETAFWKASFDSPAWRVLRAAVDGTP